MTKPILLIDLSAIFHPCWRANENGPVSVAFEGTIGGVRRAMSLCPDAAVSICCDGKGNWRKELAPSYKAKRDPLPPVFYSELDRVKQRLRDDGLLLWECPGFEADDVIATATDQACDPVTIATHDKDLFQLVDGDTRVLSLSSWEFRGEQDVIDKFGVPPAKIGDWLALVGDTSDNVPGAPGIGPVKAAELLTAYGNLLGVFKAAYDVNSALKPAVRKSILENDKQIELARKLVELRTDAPIRFEEIFETREQKPIVEVSDMDDEAAPEEIDAEPEQPSAKVEGASQEMTVIPPDYVRGLEPMSIGQAYKLAKGLFNSRLYQRFQNPEAIMAVIIRGREMGLGALTALDAFHVIEGKPAPHAYLIIARAKADQDCEYFQCIDTTPDGATWETKHRKNPQPTRLRYTIAQAQAAGVVKPGSNWTKRPDEMLRKTAGVQLARMEYPDAALGLYSIEELEA